MLGDVVMVLIEDVLEVQTIPSCELVFGFLETRMAALTLVRPHGLPAHHGLPAPHARATRG